MLGAGTDRRVLSYNFLPFRALFRDESVYNSEVLSDGEVQGIGDPFVGEDVAVVVDGAFGDELYFGDDRIHITLYCIKYGAVSINRHHFREICPKRTFKRGSYLVSIIFFTFSSE